MQRPEFVEPMLTRAASLPTDQERWAYEVKWDGMRAQLRVDWGRVRVRPLQTLEHRRPITLMCSRT